MLRWFCITVVAGILSGFAFLLVTGDYINDGPVLVTIGEHRGVHLGDLFIVTGWAVAILALTGALFSPPHRTRGGSRRFGSAE